MCLDAYLVLYDRRRLFVSIFTMLLRMGLPELRTVQYLSSCSLGRVVRVDLWFWVVISA